MSVIAVGSFTGAPGATTVAAALAASWPGSLLVEADWQGGRLAARFGLRRDPGVMTLAADREASDLAAHAQRIPLGVPVLVGPESGDAAERLWSSSGSVLARRLAAHAAPVVVDCGRLSMGSPVVMHLLPSSSAVLVVVRNDPGELAAAAAGFARLRQTVPSVFLVLSGEAPYRAAEVEAALSVPVVAVIPWDAGAAGAVSSGAPHRNLRSTRWARSVRSLADRVAVATLTSTSASTAAVEVAG
jgi:MinD-like ATPase involved in chromosome partitioning or flagellar assembly